jgi:hypothetical protein
MATGFPQQRGHMALHCSSAEGETVGDDAIVEPLEDEK